MPHPHAWRTLGRIVAAILLVALPASASGQTTPPATDPAIYQQIPSSSYHPPDGIAFRVVSIISNGTRLHGELFYPKAAEGQKLPTIISAHGWGGVAAYLRQDAVELARAGYLVIDFDYRGWGESDSRVILLGPEPQSTGNNRFTAEVQAQRGYVDPWEQVEDWFNVIDWAQGEPMVDTTRIGVRGSSYSGGHVVYVAARDRRVRVLVSQVGGVQDRLNGTDALPPGVAAFVTRAHEAATALARGEASYPDPKTKAIGNLIGAPVGDKLLRWWPNAESSFVTQPALYIVAENEELNDNKTNAIRAYENAKGPKKLVVVPGIRHYGIYGPAREEAIQLAVSWFDTYLKPARSK